MSKPHDDARLATQIAAEFRRRLQGEYVPRLRQCVAMLDEAQVWHRHGAAGNSIGNLLLHLAGNTTQWILASFTGVADRRERPAEFAASGGASGRELVERLAAVVDQACAAVDRLTVADLLAVRTVQQRYRETGIGIVLHVLEHCSGHAGQIYAFTKLLTGRDLRFYDL
jgi:uncharacterized damage-inducible protein DinB